MLKYKVYDSSFLLLGVYLSPALALDCAHRNNGWIIYVYKNGKVLATYHCKR